MLEDSKKLFNAYVHPETGTVDRIIFSDKAIYEMELERIFARAWNFMCHESQIPKPGDFFLSFIGEESVIATRDKKGNLQVLLNTCRHRGNAVCRAEQGRATSFLCTYHGWTYDLEGRLVGVPGYKDFYHEALDREQWGLPKAAKVQSYKGFVFATMDPDAVDLDEYLGGVGRIGLDQAAERGQVVAVDGVQKNQITCNWKLAVDNLFDWYHPVISHASAAMSDMPLFNEPKPAPGEPPRPPPSLQGNPHMQRAILGEYGHAIAGPRIDEQARAMMASAPPNPDVDETWRERPETVAAMGETGRDTRGHPNIFPNLWVAMQGGQLSLRLPKGPGVTEIWWFTFIDKDTTERVQDARIRSAIHVFGPAGLLEQEDGENWDQSTRATAGVVARRYPLNFAMGLGRGKPTKPSDGGPLYIDAPITEHAQLWTYRAWAEWMDAESWDSLKQNRMSQPTEAV